MYKMLLIGLLLIFVNISTVLALPGETKLAWNPNTESDLVGYKIYYGISSGNYDINIDVGNQTAYTVTGLTEGETYYYVVTAYDTSGNESGYSGEVFNAIPVIPIPDSTPPGNPSSLQIVTKTVNIFINPPVINE